MLAVDPSEIQRRNRGGRPGPGLLLPQCGHGHHGDLRLLRAKDRESGQKAPAVSVSWTALWPSCPDLPSYLWFILRLVPKPWAWEAGLLSWLFLRCSAVCPAACFLVLPSSPCSSWPPSPAPSASLRLHRMAYGRIRFCQVKSNPAPCDSHVILKRRLFAVPGSHGHKAAVV